MVRKIQIVCPHPENYALGQRLKYEQYFDSWRNDGWDMDVEPFMSEAF